MASACVNAAASPPDPSLDLAPACPRISFGPEPDANGKDLADFEFRPDDRPAAMLPADELFAGGKLLPLHFPAADPAEEVRPAEIRRLDASPKAPRCSSRWRELLGLKNKKPSGVVVAVAVGAAHSKNPNTKSFKQLLHRGSASRSTADTSLSLPLLRDSDSESVSLSSRRSLSSSSSSSGPDHEDIPRLSLDSDKPAPAATTAPAPILLGRNAARARARAAAAARASRSPARRAPDAPPPVESPRMNASGRVVFERSSSSPGSFTGGPRVRQRGMERSYSAGVRVAPVLNVPVFGLGQLFKKDRDASTAASRSAAGAAPGGGGGSSNGGTRVRIERERA